VYEEAMVFRQPRPHRGGMKKRTLSAVLWFYCGWYAGAMIAHALDVSIAIGPILGAAAAALIAGDPRGIIWSRTTVDRPVAAARLTPQPD
jgi:hypothetical protein